MNTLRQSDAPALHHVRPPLSNSMIARAPLALFATRSVWEWQKHKRRFQLKALQVSHFVTLRYENNAAILLG